MLKKSTSTSKKKVKKPENIQFSSITCPEKLLKCLMSRKRRPSADIERFTVDDLRFCLEEYFNLCIKHKMCPDILFFLNYIGFTIENFRTYINSTIVSFDEKSELFYCLEKIVCFWSCQNIQYHNVMMGLVEKLVEMIEYQDLLSANEVVPSVEEIEFVS